MGQSEELRSSDLYLDFNATTQVDPAVFEALSPFLQTRFGNPSSKHPLGVAAASAVAAARARVAEALGAIDPTSVVFTSGATECINWALRSAVKLRRHPVDFNIVCCCLEHPAGLRVCEALKEEHGCGLRLCAVDRWGLLDLEHLESLLDDHTAVVSVPLANGEVGAVQRIAEVVALVRRLSPHALIHSDASQAMGKVPVHPADLGVDLLTIAGHKIYAPKGVGALYIRKGLCLPPLILGGGQEGGLRGGTENVAFIAALAKACQLVQLCWAAPEGDTSQAAVSAAAAAAPAPAAAAAAAAAAGGRTPHPSNLGFVGRAFVEAFWSCLQRETGVARQQLEEQAVRFNGPLGSHDPAVQKQWLPGTLHLSIKGTIGPSVACGLAEAERLFVSAGVSCHQGTVSSPLLKAMQMEDTWAMGSLRISVGRHTTAAEAVSAAERLARYLSSNKLIAATHAAP